jgi:hypothetical protein
MNMNLLLKIRQTYTKASLKVYMLIWALLSLFFHTTIQMMTAYIRKRKESHLTTIIFLLQQVFICELWEKPLIFQYLKWIQNSHSFWKRYLRYILQIFKYLKCNRGQNTKLRTYKIRGLCLKNPDNGGEIVVNSGVYWIL